MRANTLTVFNGMRGNAMKKDEIIKALSDIQEIIAWNDIKDLKLSDQARERMVIDIDDAIEAFKENGEE